MSNSSVKTLAQTGAKVYFVAGDRIERQVRLQGSWLSIVDVTVPAGGSATPDVIDSPQVLRIIEGRLSIWRMADGRREEIAALAGDIVSIAAHQAYGYANPDSAEAVFSATIDSASGEALVTAGEAPALPGPIQRIGTAANSDGTTIRAA